MVLLYDLVAGQRHARLQFSQLCSLVIFRSVAKLGVAALLHAMPVSLLASGLEAEQLPTFYTVLN